MCDVCSLVCGVWLRRTGLTLLQARVAMIRGDHKLLCN